MIYSFEWTCLIPAFNPFVSNAPFLYPLDIVYQTRFDWDRMKDVHFEQIAQGIENTQSAIVFIRQKYIDKVNAENPGDSYIREFSYAAVKKTSSNMVAVLMEN